LFYNCKNYIMYVHVKLYESGNVKWIAKLTLFIKTPTDRDNSIFDTLLVSIITSRQLTL